MTKAKGTPPTGKVCKLKRTNQCVKCPWKKTADPNAIPHYDLDKHKSLCNTIAKGSPLEQLITPGPLNIMACHDQPDAHCIGWLANQLGPGNNIPLRFAMRGVPNLDRIKLDGDQHERFEDTFAK